MSKSRKFTQYVYVDCEANFFSSTERVDDDLSLLVDYDEVTNTEASKHYQLAREHFLRECADFGMSSKALFRLKKLEIENRFLKSKLSSLENEFLAFTGRSR